jgi:hypothetical protein
LHWKQAHIITLGCLCKIVAACNVEPGAANRCSAEHSTQCCPGLAATTVAQWRLATDCSVLYLVFEAALKLL